MPPLRGEDGRAIPVISNEHISRVWNSPDVKAARKKFLAGDAPAACRSCFDREALGAVSMRVEKNRLFQGRIENAVANTDREGAVPVNVVSADFRLGNTCNLRCRMCNSGSSAGLRAEELARDFVYPGEAPTDDYFWYENDKFWIEFFEKNPHLNHLEFAGGEPLLTKRFYWILDYLIATKRAAKIVLSLHTNLTHFSPELLLKLERFGGLDFEISLDGFDKVNSYIRYPSEWSQLEAHMRAIDEWARFPFRKVLVHSTISAYNAPALDRFIEFLLTFKNFGAPIFTLLDTPRELSCLSLPSELRHSAAERLERALERSGEPSLPLNWSQESRRNFREGIESVIRGLKRESDHKVDNFVRFTLQQDRFRGQNIGDFIPELAGLF